jgi:hypothetical protein
MTIPSSWRKSSRSANSPNCVEVANTLRALRDSKRPAVVLAVPREAVTALVRSIS